MSGHNATRNYRLVTKEQRRMEQMDKLRRTLARSERKRVLGARLVYVSGPRLLGGARW